MQLHHAFACLLKGFDIFWRQGTEIIKPLRVADLRSQESSCQAVQASAGRFECIPPVLLIFPFFQCYLADKTGIQLRILGTFWTSVTKFSSSSSSDMAILQILDDAGHEA
jgi:hypothetical protein